jgi:hypothetical protein
MTNAIPLLVGKCFNNSDAASYPPAEPPMPTIGQVKSFLPSGRWLGPDVADVDRVLLPFAFVRVAFFFAVRFRGMVLFII